MREDIYKRVLARLETQLVDAIAKREAGETFEMPFTTSGKLVHPQNPKGQNYRGVNFVIGLLEAMFAGRCGIYGTYRMWQELGVQVRKRASPDERFGIPVVYFQPAKSEATDSEGENTGFAFLKSYVVFAIEDTNANLDEWVKRTVHPPLEGAPDERLDALDRSYCEAQKIQRTHAPGRAFYRSSTDEVNVPPFSDFKSAQAYAATVAHELMHSTGERERTDRTKPKGMFGSPDYALEELIAEIGAAMVCANLGIETTGRDDHARYLASWLKALKDDASLVAKAAAEAQKGADFLLAYDRATLSIAAA